jgi:hypothetical protein
MKVLNEVTVIATVNNILIMYVLIHVGRFIWLLTRIRDFCNLRVRSEHRLLNRGLEVQKEKTYEERNSPGKFSPLTDHLESHKPHGKMCFNVLYMYICIYDE